MKTPGFCIHKDNFGLALIVTLAVISVLMASALYLAKITGKSVVATSLEQDRAIGQEMAISGIHLAMAILAADAGQNEIDSVQEDWANQEKLAKFVSHLGFTRGKLTLNIIDELGKLQVNALLKKFPGHDLNQNQLSVWEKFLDLGLSLEDAPQDSQQSLVILDSLTDWLDSLDDDVVTGLLGAESEYYQQLAPPYLCKNGPVNRLKELLLVRGMSKEMLLSPRSLPGWEDDSQADLPPLIDLLTVYGLAKTLKTADTYYFPGKININTAGVDILGAILPQGMDTLARDLAEYRKETTEERGTYIYALDKGWYEKVIELTEKEKHTFNSLIRYDSDLFRADTSVLINGGSGVSINLSAIIKREQDTLTGKWECRIIQLIRDKG